MAAVPRLRAFLCTDHPDRRKFLSHTLAAATATMPTINLTAAAGTEPAVKSETDPTKRKFMERPRAGPSQGDHLSTLTQTSLDWNSSEVHGT